MAELKTKVTDTSVDAFLLKNAAGERLEDCLAVMKIMKQATKAKPRMWGDSIVDFGAYTYTYGSGTSGDWPVTGFSPRKTNLTLYIMPGFERFEALMKKLGKHKTGKSCLYLKRLADIDIAVLKALVTESVRYMKASYPTKF